jgi:hypothetical protein
MLRVIGLIRLGLTGARVATTMVKAAHRSLAREEDEPGAMMGWYEGW